MAKLGSVCFENNVFTLAKNTLCLNGYEWFPEGEGASGTFFRHQVYKRTGISIVEELRHGP